LNQDLGIIFKVVSAARKQGDCEPKDIDLVLITFGIGLGVLANR